jgi:AraC-like DNA-binding protein
MVAPTRDLLRARDLADARYWEPLDVSLLARAARMSTAHFSREFKACFGETPHRYLLSRRMERAAFLLRMTDHSVAAICMSVGFQSVGSFTTTFGRTFGMTPVAYRSRHPPAAQGARIPACVVQNWSRPA